jgi:hypothetical protein
MTFSLTTWVVVTSNTITAVIAAALLMLVLWQAPRRRMNQMFAMAMFLLVAYSLSNAFGRFIGDMGWNPAHATYVAITFYGIFIIAISGLRRSSPITAPRLLVSCAGGVGDDCDLIPVLWSDSLSPY